MEFYKWTPPLSWAAPGKRKLGFQLVPGGSSHLRKPASQPVPLGDQREDWVSLSHRSIPDHLQALSSWEGQQRYLMGLVTPPVAPLSSP